MGAVQEFAPDSPERIASALSALDASNRDLWVRAAFAVKDALGDSGKDIWLNWSQDAENFDDAAAQATWKSAKAGGKVKAATLFHLARQSGWSDDWKPVQIDPAELARIRLERKRQEEQAKAAEEAMHAAAALEARKLWSAASTDISGHAYSVSKGGLDLGKNVRRGRWPQNGWDDALLVPIYGLDGEIMSLEAISPTGEKMALKGGAKAGGIYPLAPFTSHESGIVIVAEGLATAAACMKSTGYPAVAAFCDSNLRKAAEFVKAKRQDVRIVVAADIGSEEKARAAAAATGGVVAIPAGIPELIKRGTDFWDVWSHDRGDVLVRHIINAALKAGFSAVGSTPISVAEKSALVEDAITQTPARQEASYKIAGDEITDALLQHPTQDNVALVFRRQFAGRLLYAHAYECWLEWDGTRWVREETDKAFDYARDLARRMNREGKTSPSSAAFCKGVEQFSRADRAFAVRGSEFDADNYLLNTPSGTFDLRTNTLRPHDPSDRITKCTAVSPTATGGDRFLRFLSEITAEDDTLAYFLQVSLGACLSGAIESHWMLFWTGTGRNGKNTLGDLVMYIMGDYGKKIPSSTLMAKSYEAHPTEIANLQGARLAVSSEVADGDHWNEARINELTGDETLSARFMRGDFFDFRRTHKHLIFGNHRPQLRTSTDALKSRIKIVPFTQSFIGREDPGLPAALRSEAGFVLYWLLEGHAAWVEAGRKLPVCPAVEKEGNDYFESQSTVDAWIEERIDKIHDDGRTLSQWPKASDLFSDYQRWKQSRGEQPVSQTRWGETMAKKFTKGKADGVRYVGALLKPSCYA